MARYKKGFTLIEMMIVLGIFVLITTLLLSNQKKFGTNIEVTNLAYDVALSIRQTQTYGLAVKNSGLASADFTSAYGIHFDSSTPSQYIIFFDRLDPNSGTRNYVMDSGEESEIYTLRNGFTISDLCAGTCGLQKMDVVFVRPNPEAHITYTNGGQTFSATDVYLKVKSPQGKIKWIRVLKSGQISVEDNQ